MTSLLTVEITLDPWRESPRYIDRCMIRHPNGGPVEAYQECYEDWGEKFDAICYLHDDLEIYETGWRDRVTAAFVDPKVAVVSFGGAIGLGVDDVYKTPYGITQLVRLGYCSNQRDWQVHGAQEAGTRTVAVLDGFALAVSTSFLREIGGWKAFPFRFHCYDTWLCLMAARKGRAVSMVGVDCLHRGGGTSTKAEYLDWCKEHGTTPEREHAEPHRWIYEEFRDVLPLKVK